MEQESTTVTIDGHDYPLINDRYITRKSTQEALGYTYSNIYRLLESGKLDGIRLEPHRDFSPWLISVESVRAYLARYGRYGWTKKAT